MENKCATVPTNEQQMENKRASVPPSGRKGQRVCQCADNTHAIVPNKNCTGAVPPVGKQSCNRAKKGSKECATVPVTKEHKISYIREKKFFRDETFHHVRIVQLCHHIRAKAAHFSQNSVPYCAPGG